ncbi:MAG: ABC transporter permease, partial [Longimicrobiaceae bacterium]
MMETLLRDLRYAGRALARRPWFTGVVVLTLALGIGANTAVFSIINAFLLRPLPGVYEPGRLVHLFGARDGDPARYSFSYPAYQDYQAASTSLSGLAAWAVSPVSVGEGEPGAEATALLVSENFFRVAGVRPALGRFPTADESSTPGAAPVVMLGYAAWQRRFGGDPHVLGRTIRVNGFPFTVIGVTPRDFGGMVPIFAPDVWVPLMMANQVKPGADRLGDRKIAWLSFTGRLGAGATLASTAARLQAAARELGRTAPDPNRGDGVT